MSASALPWALGMLLGGASVAVAFGERVPSGRRGMSRPRRRSAGGESGGEPGGEPERGEVVGGRAWSLVVLVSVLIAATMLGVGGELLVGRFRKRALA